MKKLFLFLLLIIANTYINGQMLTYQTSIGTFNDASAISLNATGFIYVADKGSNMIYKLDTLGKSLISIGGYGWQTAAFDEPVDIFSTTLDVFVSDRNNHRIQRFDKDLNFVSQFNKRESKNLNARFGYPLGCAVSNLGDFYVLDSENKRIIKFDPFGNFELKFGGFDAAKFMLTNPKKIGVAPDNRIYVQNEHSIFAYDNFGNGIRKMELGYDVTTFTIVGNSIVLFYGRDFILGDLINGTTKRLEITYPDDFDFSKIVSFTMWNSKLYILLKNEIMVFVAGE